MIVVIIDHNWLIEILFQFLTKAQTQAFDLYIYLCFLSIIFEIKEKVRKKNFFFLAKQSIFIFLYFKISYECFQIYIYIYRERERYK